LHTFRIDNSPLIVVKTTTSFIQDHLYLKFNIVVTLAIQYLTKMQLHVLLIDASETIFQHLNRMIQKLKNIHLMGHAFTIFEAKNFLKKETLNVVILDVDLKEENGIDLLSFINSNKPLIKVIIFSNNSNSFYRKKCKSLGAYAFFDKSYEFDKLPDCLEEILQNKKNAKPQ